VEILECQPATAMVYGASQWWYSWTGDPKDVHRDHITKLGIEPNVLVSPPRLLTLFLHKTPVPGTSNVLVRREIVQRIGGFESGFRRLYTDQAFYAKLCVTGPIFVSGECFDRYRQHARSCCAVGVQTGELALARLFYFDWLKRYLSVQGISDPELWRSLKRNIRRHRYPVLWRTLASGRHRLAQTRDAVRAVGGLFR
jgi:hypothetical protein